MRRLTEEEYGRLWRKMAKKEGHKKGVPQNAKPPLIKGHRPREETAREMKRLTAEGMTMPEICKRLGMARTTAADIAKRYRVKVTPGAPSGNPSPVPRKKKQ